MKIKITHDYLGFAVWPDIELKKDTNFYDPKCEYRGEKFEPGLLNYLDDYDESLFRDLIDGKIITLEVKVIK